MATVSRAVFYAESGAASLSYQYDDVTLLISTLVIVNNAPLPFYLELRDSTTFAVLWSGQVVHLGMPSNPPATIQPGTYDISSLNLHMSTQVIWGQSLLMPPYNIYARYPA